MKPRKEWKLAPKVRYVEANHPGLEDAAFVIHLWFTYYTQLMDKESVEEAVRTQSWWSAFVRLDWVLELPPAPEIVKCRQRLARADAKKAAPFAPKERPPAPWYSTRD